MKPRQVTGSYFITVQMCSLSIQLLVRVKVSSSLVLILHANNLTYRQLSCKDNLYQYRDPDSYQIESSCGFSDVK